MKSRSKLLLLFATVVAVTLIVVFAAPRAMTQTAGNSAASASYAKAVAYSGRMPQDVWLDNASKPADVLKFIGVKPGDKVVDFDPGSEHIVSMYWSRLLYRVVGDKGKVYPFVPLVGCRGSKLRSCLLERDIEFTGVGYKNLPEEMRTGNPRWNGIDEALDVEHTTNFRNLYTLWEVVGQFDVPEQVDVIWSTSHWSWLHSRDYQANMPEMLGHMLQSLKPGGVLVIADYAANAGRKFDDADDLHRSDQAAVKEEVTKAGFVFDSESKLWANADDKHTRSVAFETAPGAFDMYIMKFKKPANAAPPKRLSAADLAKWRTANGVVTSAGSEGHAPAWYNADWTYQEYRPGETFFGTWYTSAAGYVCQRYEWPVLAQGLVNCFPVDANTKLETVRTYPPQPGGGGGRGRGRGGEANDTPDAHWNDGFMGRVK